MIVVGSSYHPEETKVSEPGCLENVCPCGGKAAQSPAAAALSGAQSIGPEELALRL